MTLKEVADLIESPAAAEVAHGNYLNRRGIRGYYLQTKCGDNWCKVSISHADIHADRITVAELDTISADSLEKALVIPTSSIASALRSTSAEEVPVNKYLNSTDVEGIWAEFRHNRNWYMISVSHVEVPAHAKPEELDRIADDFLWQQERMRRRRFGW